MSRVPMASDFHYLIGEDGFVPVGHFFLPFNVYLEDTRLAAQAKTDARNKAAERVMAKQAAEAKAEVVVLSSDTPEETEALAVLPRFDRSVRVFEMKQLLQTRQKISSDKEARVLKLLQSAEKNNGLRLIPAWDDLPARFAALRTSFPNFSEVLDALACDLILSTVQPPDRFRVSPLLLAGDPGIGKTLLASELAKSLGLPFAKISAGGAQGPFDFVGTSRNWSNAHPGRVFELLAQSDSASGVLLIDEVDKMAQDPRNPILPALLDLLEGDSARQFRDEACAVTFDASRLIILLTANDLDAIQKPLMSRLQVYEAEGPTALQRSTIIRRLVEKLQEGTQHRVDLPDSECDRLAEATSLDLRELQRRVTRAYATALVTGVRELVFELPTKAVRQRMGFIG